MADFDPSANQVVVAIDHARYFGTIEGLTDPARLLKEVLSAEADSVLVSYGLFKRFREHLRDRLPVLLRLDGGCSVYREGWLTATQWTQLHPVHAAQQLGAAAVCVMLFMGSEVELATMQIIGSVAEECYGKMPVVVEALPCPNPNIHDTLDAEPMAAACRLAFEHGADMVCTYFTGSGKSFRRVIENCPVPVFITGGARMNSVEEVLVAVSESMEAGAKGVVFGRNVWQAENPGGMVAALREIVHDGASVETALKLTMA